VNILVCYDDDFYDAYHAYVDAHEILN